MDMHGNIDMMGVGALKRVSIAIEQNLPSDPSPGRFVMLPDKVVYVCVEIEGDLPVWVPITRPRTMVRWTQNVAALEWTIPHDLAISRPLIQCFDADGKVIIPDSIIATDIDQVTIAFNTPMVGTVILMRGETEGSAQPLIAFEAGFSDSDEWVINHQLGYNPSITVIIGQNVVQPQSITYTDVNHATVTFSSPHSGSVRCI